MAVQTAVNAANREDPKGRAQAWFEELRDQAQSSKSSRSHCRSARRSPSAPPAAFLRTPWERGTSEPPISASHDKNSQRPLTV
jgi:hypothetical protein